MTRFRCSIKNGGKRCSGASLVHAIKCRSLPTAGEAEKSSPAAQVFAAVLAHARECGRRAARPCPVRASLETASPQRLCFDFGQTHRRSSGGREAYSTPKFPGTPLGRDGRVRPRLRGPFLQTSLRRKAVAGGATRGDASFTGSAQGRAWLPPGAALFFSRV